MTTAQNLQLEEFLRIDNRILNYGDIPKMRDSFPEVFRENPYCIGVKFIDEMLFGNTEEAIKQLDSITVSNSFTHTARGIYWAQKKNKEKALEYFNVAQESDGASLNKYLLLELYFFYKDYDDILAWDALTKGREKFKDFQPYKIAEAYGMDAIENCKEIISLLAPWASIDNDVEAVVYLASAYYNCGAFDECNKLLNEILEKSPTSSALQLAGTIEENKGNFSRARDLLKESIQKDSTNTGAMQALAWAYYDLNDLKEAELFFEKVLVLEKTPENYHQMTLFQFLIKNYEKCRYYNAENVKRFGIQPLNEVLFALINQYEKISTPEEYNKEIQRLKSIHGVEIVEFIISQYVGDDK